MPPPTPLEKAFAELQKCREETYGTPFLKTLRIPQPPAHPFVGYSKDSHSTSAKAAEKSALLVKEKQEEAAKRIEATKRERQALEKLREKSPWLFFSSTTRTTISANPSPQRSRHSSFGSVRSSP